MTGDRIVLSLDIGSERIRAAVGSVSRDQLMIDSICERASEGVKNGKIVDPVQAGNCIRSVISEAQRQAGVNTKTLVTGICSSDVVCKRSTGVVGIYSKDQAITYSDICRALDVARSTEIPPKTEIVHTLVQDYTVDEKVRDKSPVNTMGHRLEINSLLVCADSRIIRSTESCFSKLNIHSSRNMVQILADADVVLNEEDKKRGVILINLGAQTSGIIAYSNGYPVHLGGIDLGGDHVTNDISYISKRPKQEAALIKHEFGNCYLPSVNSAEYVDIPASNGLPSVRIPKVELSKIIEARMAEIFTILKKQLDDNVGLVSYGAGVFLVGGGSLLSGVNELCAEIFGMPVKLSFPEALPGLDRNYINPRYTTILGLLKNEVKNKSVSFYQAGEERKRGSESSFFRKISNFFRTVV